MSSYCEKNFPVCADDINVTVTNFNATVKDECSNGGGGHNLDGKNGPPPPPPCIMAKVLTKVSDVEIVQPLTDSIFIPEAFYSIKHISRRLILTQCYVVPNKIKDCHGMPYFGGGNGDMCDAHLFVEGYILKNIEYATPSENQSIPSPCNDCIVMKNDYKDLSAKIEFSFSVPIALNNVEYPKDIKEKEAAILKDCMKPCDKGSMSESGCERLYSQSVKLQEPFTCELDKYSISEAVISKTNCSTTDPELYDTVVEKLSLTLEIAIFQLQVKELKLCPPM